MRAYLRVLLPILVLVGAVLGARVIVSNPPEPQMRPDRVTLQSVDVTELVRSDHQVVIRSRGIVRPTQANTLVAEVTGSITDLSDTFVLGGAFSAGDTLVQFDRRDYEIALTRARASRAQAVARLEEQVALAEQAALEWRQLGRRGEPSALTLRKPQLAAARADRDAAAAEFERAELDLERTRIIAPYDGRVLERAVDPGQFVNRGGIVGRIHAIDSIDVRLPLGAREQAFLVQPPSTGDLRPAPAVRLAVQNGLSMQTWNGRLVRIEGVDDATRQLDVVAEVADPWADPSAPLRIGQYVEAYIDGEILHDVIVVPRQALREGREVVVVDEHGELQRREVVIAWSDDEIAIISDGLSVKEWLVVSPLATVANGTPVRALWNGSEVGGRDAPVSDEARSERRLQGADASPMPQPSSTPSRSDPATASGKAADAPSRSSRVSE